MEKGSKPRISCTALRVKIKNCPKLQKLFGSKATSKTFSSYLNSINCKCGNWCSK